MFTPAIVKAVVVTVENDIAGKKIHVTNPDLADLISATEVVLPDNVDEEINDERGNPISVTRRIAGEMLNNNERNDRSEEYLEKLSDAYARKIDGVVDFTKNVVIPTTVDLGNIMYTIVDETKETSTKELLEVTALSVPSFAPAILRAHQGKVAASVPPPPESRVPYKEISMVNLFTQVSNNQINEAVLTWASALDKEVLSEHLRVLYDEIKSAGSVKNYTTKLDPFARVEFALIALTTVGNVVDADSDFGQLHNVTSLNNFKVEMQAYAASLLASSMKFIKVLRGRGTVILRNEMAAGAAITDTRTPKLFVDSEGYAQYLKDGGTKEALIGRGLGNGREVTVEQLLPKTLSYLTMYRKSSRIADTMLNRRILTVLQRELRRTIKELHDKIVKEGVYTSAIPDDALGMIDTYVGGLGAGDLEDLTSVAKNIVANLLLGNSPAGEILSKMENFSSAGTDDVDECAFLAVTEYLIDYVAEGMHLHDALTDVPKNLI